VLAPSSNNGYGGLGDMARPFMRTGWRALLAADILQKLLLQYRPHELESGQAERVYEACLDDVCRTIESTPVKPAVQLRRCARRSCARATASAPSPAAATAPRR
jgi:predicted nucleotide-binding protein (sugar kinase/HSP70/actin superfamily)